MLSIKVFLRAFSLLFLLILISCSPQPSRFGVVFTKNNLDIYQMPDNTQRKVEQLTFTPTVGEYGVMVSKRGEEIIFQAGLIDMNGGYSESRIEKHRHIYLLDTTSKELVDITSVLVEYEQVWQNFSMDWLPNQKQYIVLADKIIDSEIRNYLEIVNSNGESKEKILIPSTGEGFTITQSIMWSPDGSKVVLTQGVVSKEDREQYPGSAIMIYDLEIDDIVQITDYKDQCLPREWSPTSQAIVATCSSSISASEGVSTPRIIRIFDTENIRLPYEGIAFNSCYDPSWSPNGKHIVFVCDKEVNQSGIFIVNSNGDNLHEVNLRNLGDFTILKDPIWSPDGTQIVYVAGSDAENTKIYSVNRDGSNNHPLTDQEAYYILVSVYPVP